MYNQNRKNTEAKQTAVEEGKITPLQLLQEIQPLLEEYFIGSFNIKNDALSMNFLNGNKFILTISE